MFTRWEILKNKAEQKARKARGSPVNVFTKCKNYVVANPDLYLTKILCDIS